MELNFKLTKPITETKYLSETNCSRYRPILRYFYYQYEKLAYRMHKEEVFEALKKHPFFEAYTFEQCKHDLDALVEWGNLIPVQDTSRATTIDEFKNKQFRYHLSEYSVEIERLTIRLENLAVEGASLEPSLFEKLLEGISKIRTIGHEPLNVIDAWWRSLNADFKTLNQDYQDYMRSFYSLKAEERMKTKEFIAYKDALINYLRNFVKGLQRNAQLIERVLKDIPPETVASVLSKVIEYEKSIPRLDALPDEAAIKENVEGRWQSIRGWFLGEGSAFSEVSRVLDLTNEIIRKITRYAAQIAESRNSAANRKEEYKALCKLFLSCTSIDEAHQLSAMVFGIFHMRHLKGDFERATESIASSVYEENPHVISIKPRIRTYREKMSRNCIEDKKEKKNSLQQAYMKELEQEQKIMNGFLKDNTLKVAQLPVIERHVRMMILRWISKAMAASDKSAKTEDGRVYKLLWDEKSYCTLQCTDGDLTMPAFILEFEGEQL
ncbi:MAG: TIGR02677 family protein [Hyphomonadaceae bacterium]|nr:TIGR02677 family protein [Clostridia bacterium]